MRPPAGASAPDGEGLVVSYSALLGGAERLLLDLVPSLDMRVRLACPDGPLAEAAIAAGLAWEELRPRRLELRGSARDRIGAPLRLVAQARELRRIVGRVRPAWAIAWSMRPALSLALAAPRGRTPVMFQHNDFLPRGMAGHAARAAAGRADVVCALSHAVARDLDPPGRLAGRMVVSHPGVEVRRFAPTPLPREGVEALVLGALVGWKRPDLALEVAAHVPGLRLLMAGASIGAGDAALVSALHERARRPDLAGRVEFLGRVDDPRPLLARASLLLHCSDREPFGLALVEALASGRPVVAPAAGGPLEIVDSGSGRLYPPGNAAAAAREVGALLGDSALLEELARGARERAERHFDLTDARARFAAAVALLHRRS